ncbi:TatD family hydrolase [Alphaproteobacteria bacterium]|nr:TatD family hydrolase [Alphaproteobacteria bacterium]
MIDSHCHLNFDNLANNIDDIINKAKKNSITSILSINTDPEEFDNHYQLIKQFKSIFLSYGLHPQQVTQNKIISSIDIINNSSNDRVIAIGETGLDFFHSLKYKKEQHKVFENHIEASYETNLPLIIHQRNSENEIIDILTNFQKSKPLNVVFHCFTGTSKLRNFCLDNDFYLSLSGIITFKNAEDLRKVIKNVPLSSLLIETDSPFLAPTPHRGKVNEPSFVKHVAEYLSIFFKLSLEEFISITDNNFYKLFSKAIRYNEISI